MQQIYTAEESHDRLRFTQFFTQHFVLHRKTTSMFRHPISSDWLHTLYTRLYPDTRLSAADLELYFTIIGVENTEQIFVDLFTTKKEDLSETFVNAVCPHLTIPTVRQLDATLVSEVSMDVTITGFKQFHRLFVKHVRGDEKTTTKRAYTLYSLFCATHDFPTVSTKRFTQLFNSEGYSIRKGYAEGLSGVNYIKVAIPNDDLWECSLKVGLGVFPYLNKLYDNQGKQIRLDDDGKPVDLPMELYIKDRIKRRRPIDESQTTADGSAEQGQEEKTSSDIDGRADEGSSAYVSGTTPPSNTETDNDANEASGKLTEEPKATETPRSKLRASANAGSKSPKHKDRQGDCIAESVERVIQSAERPNDESYDDNEDPERDFDVDEEYNEEPPSKKEIFAALQIAYKINPVTFDQRTMNSYLVSMGVDYAASDLWDEFMKFVGGNK